MTLSAPQSDPPLRPPNSPPDGYVPPTWQFPSVIGEEFDLQPEYEILQSEFALSKLMKSLGGAK
jgi:hypothetical protein